MFIEDFEKSVGHVTLTIGTKDILYIIRVIDTTRRKNKIFKDSRLYFPIDIEEAIEQLKRAV